MEYNKQTAHFFILTEKAKKSYYERLDLNNVSHNKQSWTKVFSSEIKF